MKKVASLAITLLMMIGMCGCAEQNILKSNDISDSFDGNIEVISGGKNYKCEFLHTPEKSNVIKIIEPKELCGLTFSWEDDKYNVSWKELKCEFSKKFLPDSSFLSDIVCVMDSISNKELLNNLPDDGDDSIYTGNCEIGNFKVVFDRSGILKQIDIEEKSIHVKAESKA